MAQTIKLKRTAVASRVPATSALSLGEIGINTYDGKLFIKKNVSGVESIVQVGDTSAFLPLSGGTLTGGLLGTTASFSSTITSSNFVSGSYLKIAGNAFIARDVGNTNGSLWLAALSSGTGTANKVTIAGGASAYAAFNSTGANILGTLQINNNTVIDASRNITAGTVSATGNSVFTGNTNVTGSSTIGSTAAPLRTLDSRGSGMAIFGTGSYSEIMLRERSGTLRNTGAWHWSVRGDVGGANDDLKLLRFTSGSYQGIAMQLASSSGAATFSGAITATGATFTDTVLMSGSGFLNVTKGLGVYVSNNLSVGGLIYNTGGNDVEVSGNLRINSGGLKIGSTTVIDSSRNLTNINNGTFGGTLGVTGAASFNSTVAVTTDLNVGGAVKGNAGTRAVSVGTAGSVAGGLQLWADTDEQSFVQFGDEAGTAANHYRGFMGYNHATDAMQLGTASAARVTIDSSGNVGIGNSIASSMNHSASNLVIGSGASSDNTGLTIYSNANASGSIHFADSTSGADAYRGFIYYTHGSSNFLAFGTNATERMRIDSSGNVLVGKPATTFSAQGTVLNANGTIDSTRSGDAPLYLNRLSNAGSIIQLYKDTVSVGSIGAYDDTTVFAGKFTALKMNYYNSTNSVIHTTTPAGVIRDGVDDLGYASSRFRNLFLSGTANTGSQIIFPEKSTGTEINSSIRNHTNNYTYMFGGSSGLIFANNTGEDCRIKLNDNNTIEFITSSTERLRLTSGGDLYKLGGTIQGERGTASAPAYSFHDDPDTGMFNISNANLGFSVGGSEKMRIDSSGIVLFKKTSPSVNVAGGYIDGYEAIMSLADGQNTYLVRSTTSNTYTYHVSGDGSIYTAGSLAVGGNINNYVTVNSGNPEFSMGSSATNRLLLQTVYNSGSQILNYVTLRTYTTANHANAGRITLGVDEVDILEVNDGGIGVTGDAIATRIVGRGVIESSSGFSSDTFAVMGVNTSNSATNHGAVFASKHADSNALLVGSHDATFNSFAVKGDGKCGIGTTAPSASLEISGFSSGAGLKLNYGNSNGTIDAINFIANNGANGTIGMQMVSAGVGDLWLGGSGGRSLTLYRNGNVGVGISDPAGKLHVNGLTGSVPTILEGSGNGDTAPLHFRVKANNGNVTNHGIFGNAGTAGSDNTIQIGPSSTSGITIYANGNAKFSGRINGSTIGTVDAGIQCDQYANAIKPFRPDIQSGTADNYLKLGTSSVRWTEVFAVNGTIQTSDRNEKQDIEVLSTAEQRVAVAAKSLLRKFRWKDAVAEKGDGARIHFGIIAQDLQAAFVAEGLDAGRYGMFTSDTWDEDGVDKTRMGVRYSELLAFIISAI